MLSPGDRLLVGVSGGPDSLACLLALTALREKFNLTLKVLYVDHGLRPREARQEAALVQGVCRNLGVAFSVCRRKIERSGGESLEEACRKARYDALSQAARRGRFKTIALGHTQDDQAETVLMWIIRGTGTAGLAGIPPVRREGRWKVVRPLLEISRQEVEGFLKAHRIRPSRDSMNDSDRFARNRIRKELLPLLCRRYNPQIRRHLARLADFSREQKDFLEAQAQQALRAAGRFSRQGAVLDLKRLARLPAGLRQGVFRAAVERLKGDRDGLDASHWLALDRMAEGKAPAAVDLPHGLRALSIGAPSGKLKIVRR